MVAVRLPLLLAAAGLVALLSPAFPALQRYGALPHAPERPINVLLAGTTPNYQETAAVWPWPATPEDYTGLTDTIVLAQFRRAGDVKLLSIPRDTWVNIPGSGYGKINAANPRGGPDTLVAATERLTGLHIDSYALLSLNALRDLTNASGGVTLDVPERMKYDDNAGHLHVDLQSGVQHLSGEQVEGFLRFRHDAMGDVGRVSRQQLYFQAMGQRLKNPLHAWRLPGVVGALNRNMKSDLSRSEVGGVLGSLLGGARINTFTLPGSFGAGGTWAANPAEIRALVSREFTDPNDPRARSVAIANIDAPNGAARALQSKLLKVGYSNVWIADLPRAPSAVTVVAGNSDAAQTVQRDLGYGQAQVSGGASGADVTVLLGRDTPAPQGVN